MEKYYYNSENGLWYELQGDYYIPSLFLGDADTVLEMIYECYNENHPYDNEEIKADFNELYRQMSGIPLREMDKIIYPVCKLCREHEKAGFIEGIKIGIRLLNELA